MNKMEKIAAGSLPVVMLAGAGLALAGSHGTHSVWGLPLYAVLVCAVFLIQWLAFIPAYLFQTEKFYDLCGSLTYVTVVCSAALLNPRPHSRAILLLVLVLIWALRLGTFLFRRVRRAGKDSRFDVLKPSFVRFLLAWTLQGLWVSFTLAAALAVMTSVRTGDLDLFAWIGLGLWILGFGMEATADLQKNRFHANPENTGQFIRFGLWSRSRHPNYFGEIVLWTGVAVIALPVLHGWQWITLVSPFFVTLLLTRISGIPLLEKRADEKWGGQKDYEQYKSVTPVLIPRIWKL